MTIVDHHSSSDVDDDADDRFFADLTTDYRKRIILETSAANICQALTRLKLLKVEEEEEDDDNDDDVEPRDWKNETPVGRRTENVLPVLREHTYKNVRISSLLDSGTFESYSRAVRHHELLVPECDHARRLEKVYFRLSVCGFYWGRMSFDEARVRLERRPVGTFLLRDSSDPRYMFSLSVQTQRGTTSVRILYDASTPDDRFSLVGDPDHPSPAFDCVIRLVQHHCTRCGGGDDNDDDGTRGSSCPCIPPPHHDGSRGRPACPELQRYVFIESSGRRDTPILLRRPMDRGAASMKHLCRKRINGLLRENDVSRLQLTPSLREFLSEYPYDI